MHCWGLGREKVRGSEAIKMVTGTIGFTLSKIPEVVEMVNGKAELTVWGQQAYDTVKSIALNNPGDIRNIPDLVRVLKADHGDVYSQDGQTLRNPHIKYILTRLKMEGITLPV